MNAVAMADNCFPHGVAVGYDLARLPDALRVSPGHCPVGSWADAGGAAADQHPPVLHPAAPLLGRSFALRSPVAGQTHTFLNG